LTGDLFSVNGRKPIAEKCPPIFIEHTRAYLQEQVRAACVPAFDEAAVPPTRIALGPTWMAMEIWFSLEVANYSGSSKRTFLGIKPTAIKG
jgi:hypothetical protein